MNPYQHQCTCSVCGEPGLAHVRHAGEEWLGGVFTHRDPSVCARNIAAQKRHAETKRAQSQVMAGEGAGI